MVRVKICFEGGAEKTGCGLYVRSERNTGIKEAPDFFCQELLKERSHRYLEEQTWACAVRCLSSCQRQPPSWGPVGHNARATAETASGCDTLLYKALSKPQDCLCLPGEVV